MLTAGLPTEAEEPPATTLVKRTFCKFWQEQLLQPDLAGWRHEGVCWGERGAVMKSKQASPLRMTIVLSVLAHMGS